MLTTMRGVAVMWRFMMSRFKAKQLAVNTLQATQLKTSLQCRRESSKVAPQPLENGRIGLEARSVDF